MSNGNGNGKAYTGVLVWLGGLTLTSVFGAGMLFERVNTMRDTQKEVQLELRKYIDERLELRRIETEKARIDAATALRLIEERKERRNQ